MRRVSSWGIASVVAGAFALAGGALFAERASSQDAEAMKRWQAACTPGKQHAELKKFVGSWDTTMRMWMGPGTPPLESKGSAEFRWLMEGRWLQQDYKGSMMGQPMRGFGLQGYDNFKQKHVSMWVDDSTTTLTTSEGNLDQTGKILWAFGLMDEPMTGEHDKTVRYVTRWLADDKFVFEIHDLPMSETEPKVVEITYTRRKADAPAKGAPSAEEKKPAVR